MHIQATPTRHSGGELAPVKTGAGIQKPLMETHPCASPARTSQTTSHFH